MAPGMKEGMSMIPDSARRVIDSDALAHVVTLDTGGRPHVTLAWTGMEGDDIVFATLQDQRKLQNCRRDPRVTLSYETSVTNEYGLREYLVVHGTAQVTEGGAAALLQQLAYTYLGPDVVFPPFPNPPAGFVTRVAVERVGGVGPWASR